MSLQFHVDSGHVLAETVRRTLAGNPHFVGRRLDVVSQGDAVVLTGSVASWYQKQVAQESIRGLAGVGRIRNELHVVPQVP